MPVIKPFELRFPSAGVVRRSSQRSILDRRGGYPSPWATNVRLEDNLDRRLRGGSRPGLTKYADGEVIVSDITDMASINVSRTTGASEVLLILSGTIIRTIEAGATSPALFDILVTEVGGSNEIQNAGGDAIHVSVGSVPASGFLVTGQQHVFAVGTSAITKIDPKEGAVSPLDPSAGTVPTGCTFGAVYRDRLCLSGEDNAIYMSRQGDYTDWGFGDDFEDTQRAVAYQLSLSADVGALPTAMIPCMDKYMVCATTRSLWVVKGDPTADGSLERISEHVGIIHSRAWCKFDTNIVFLSEDGLYMIQADGSNLTPLSPESLPEELRDVNLSTYTVSLGWDQDHRAVHIYVKKTPAVGADTHWLYELDAKAFWPMHLPAVKSPVVVCQHDGELLLAGEDKYIRKIGGDDDDDSDPIESHVLVGPFRLGRQDTYGMLQTLHGIIANGSGTVNWWIVPGDSADEAADNGKLAIEAFQAEGDYSPYVRGSGSWTAGRGRTQMPRVQALWACLWLQSTAKWAYEGITLTSVQSGKYRG